MSRLILQIAGEARAGKTEVRKHLAKDFGFNTILVSDIIRDFAHENGLPLGPRKNYLAAHKEMKLRHGVEIVSNTILQLPGDRIAVDGIRVPNDVKRLREVGSKVIALHCPVDIRYERAKNLKSAIDPLNYEQFIQDDENDAYNPDPEAQNTLEVMREADYHIDSSLPLSALISEVDDIVVPLLG